MRILKLPYIRMSDNSHMTRMLRQTCFAWLVASIAFFILTSVLHFFYLDDSPLSSVFQEMWNGNLAKGFIFLTVLFIIPFFWQRNYRNGTQQVKHLALLVSYIILGLDFTIALQYFFTQTHLLFISFITAGCLVFFLAAHFAQASPILRLSGTMLVTTALIGGFGHWLPQVEGGYPTHTRTKKNVFEMTVQQRADLGEEIIFGGFGQSKIRGSIGKGQCPLCHTFFSEHGSERAPNLWGITARKRLHATSIEYIAESHVCPTCYVVGGFGVKGTENRVSPMPRIHKPPISLTIPELIAVDTWLYVKDGETPPHPGVIEDIYRKLIPKSERPLPEQHSGKSNKDNFQRVLVTGDEPIETLFTIAGCTNCHAIPGIHSYRRHLARKKSIFQITSNRAAISKAILDPTHHPIKLYPDHKIPIDHGRSITALALEKMVDHLARK